MQPIEFILGRSGAGKTNYCYEAVAKELEEEAYGSLIVLVPEQFNLQTQKDLAKKLYPGLLRAEVLSFNTLARSVFQEVGKENIPVIEDLERMIILKKVIEEHKKELVFYKKNINNTGFIESVNRLITMFEQSGLGQAELEEMIGSEAVTSLFQSKLVDLQKIYGYFEEYISTQFLTIEKNMSLLAQSIHKSKTLSQAQIWIDGFYGFTMTQLNIIRELMKKAKKVSITLPMDRVYGLTEKVRTSHPFYESIQMYQRLMGICEGEKLTYKTKFLTPVYEEGLLAPEFIHLEENYLKPYQQPFKEESNAIRLNTYSCRMEEVEAVAKRIVSLVRDEGYRYHDIALIVGDVAEYKSLIQSSFKEYEIPYFLDIKRNIHTNSLVAAIEGVLDVVTGSYSYKSMMAFLRTYMLPISREDIDILENYILAYGIKGKKKWQQEWQYDTEESELQAHINAVRLQILEPIMAFEKRIKEGKVEGQIKVVDLTSALFYFLQEIGAYETLQKMIAKNKEEDNRLLELENTQILGQIIEVFERLVDLLGDERLDVNTYKRILETSFSYLKMGVIPPASDEVLIGEIERTRLPRLKALFILGTNEGLIPKTDEATPIFSDMDKVTLGQLCETGSEAKGRFSDLIINQPLYGAAFMVYTTLTRATKKLYLSAALSDENGKPLRPSLIFYRLGKMFRQPAEDKHMSLLDEVYRPLPTFGYIGSRLREYIEGREQGEDWKDVVSWYATSPAWKERLKGLGDYLFYSNQQHYLNPETTKLLYNEPVLKTSISRLENFRNCACCYFMKYGIKAEERKVFEWNSAEVGTLFHATLEQYPKELALMGTTWTEAQPQEMQVAVKKATDSAMEQLKRLQRDSGRFKYTASKVEKMARRAIKALTTHLKNGEFRPVGYEINFGEGQGFPPIQIDIDESRKVYITGQIDRVDIYYKDPETSYVKILDYKTGNKNFNLLEVYYGLQLQLLLYLDAYLKLNHAYEPGGVFYFHINNPYVTYKVGMEEDEIEANHMKQFKLSGLVLEQMEVIKALDKTGTGSTIPVTLNKDESVRKGSSTATTEQFELLEEHIIDAVRDLGTQILEGKVSAKPFKLGDKNPCVYCTYSTICQFNESQPDNCFDKLENLSKEEIWRRIESKEEGF